MSDHVFVSLTPQLHRVIDGYEGPQNRWVPMTTSPPMTMLYFDLAPEEDKSR